MVTDSAFTIELMSLIIEHHDHVVITAGDYFVLCRHNFKAPNFTLEVRLHDAVLRRAFLTKNVSEF